MAGAVIIGAGPLIGRSLARRFAREGLPVTLIARKQSTVDAIVNELRSDGHSVDGLRADVSDERALKQALDAALSAHGIPELLVYNAAIIRSDALGELTAAELLDTLAVNVVGAVVAAAHVGPLMAEAGRGTIVITGGMPDPVPTYFSLSLGKAAVRAVTALLAEELGPSGVHVATVTVGGAVSRGGAYDPDTIAGTYWGLHRQAPDQWQREVVLSR